ncbi:MAG: hypothetical protein Q9166_005513 [cf. Caloplaca sp. 2 TL-2023]
MRVVSSFKSATNTFLEQQFLTTYPSAAIVSVVRLYYIRVSKDTDFTWNYVNVIIWAEVKSSVALICACFPSLRPLLTVAFHAMRSTSYRKPTLKLLHHTHASISSDRWKMWSSGSGSKDTSNFIPTHDSLSSGSSSRWRFWSSDYGSPVTSDCGPSRNTHSGLSSERRFWSSNSGSKRSSDSKFSNTRFSGLGRRWKLWSSGHGSKDTSNFGLSQKTHSESSSRWRFSSSGYNSKRTSDFQLPSTRSTEPDNGWSSDHSSILTSTAQLSLNTPFSQSNNTSSNDHGDVDTGSFKLGQNTHTSETERSWKFWSSGYSDEDTGNFNRSSEAREDAGSKGLEYRELLF